MKITLRIFSRSVCIALLLITTKIWAQGVPQAGNADSMTVVSVDGDSRTWRDAAGHQVVEIATGMNYFDGVSQQWVKSDPSFVAAPDGTTFFAQRMQHQVTLTANLNNVAALTAVTPDGITLKSTPVAIELYDAASGKSVVVASLTDSTGVLIDAQHVIYPKALVGDLLQADVIYSLPDCGSFHQDVIISKFSGPIDPTAFGFPASSTNTLRIQFFTEFYGSVPDPQRIMLPLYVEKDPTARTNMASPDLIDYTLIFGNNYVFAPGRAAVGTPATGESIGGLPRNGVRVAKNLVTTGQPARTFLVESVPYVALRAGLLALPPVQTARRAPLPGGPRIRVAASEEGRVSRPGAVAKASQFDLIPCAGKGSRSAVVAHQDPAERLAVLETLRKPHVLIDPVTIIGPTNTYTTFSNGATYFVSGTTYLTDATIQNGAVFKYPKSAAGFVDAQGTLTIDMSRSINPVIFTAGDDNTHDTNALNTNIWSGYTGTVSGYYANPALQLEMQSFNSFNLTNLEFYFAESGVDLNVGSEGLTFNLVDSLLTNCVQGIIITGGGGTGSGGPGGSMTYLGVSGCQMVSVETNFDTSIEGVYGNATNCTFDTSTLVISHSSSAVYESTWLFTNCIFTNVSTLTNGAPSINVTVETSQLGGLDSLVGSHVLITGNFDGTAGGVIQTMDFQTGNIVNEIAPNYPSSGIGNGRAIAIYGTNIYYTDADGSAVHVEPYGADGSGGTISTDLGNPDTNTPPASIQGLAIYAGKLYA